MNRSPRKVDRTDPAFPSTTLSRSAEGAVLEGKFGTAAAAQAKTPTGIQQVVAAVIGEAQGDGADQEGAAVAVAERIRFVRSDQLAADAPDPFLLEQYVGLPLQHARQGDGGRVIGNTIDVADGKPAREEHVLGGENGEANGEER